MPVCFNLKTKSTLTTTLCVVRQSNPIQSDHRDAIRVCVANLLSANDGRQLQANFCRYGRHWRRSNARLDHLVLSCRHLSGGRRGQLIGGDEGKHQEASFEKKKKNQSLNVNSSLESRLATCLTHKWPLDGKYNLAAHCCCCCLLFLSYIID